MPQLHIPLTDSKSKNICKNLVEELSDIGLTFDHTLTDEKLVLDFADTEEVQGYLHESDGTPSIDVNLPLTGRLKREDITQIEEMLLELGVTFDTGTGLVGPPTRCWQMDWSLEGAKVKLPRSSLTTKFYKRQKNKMSHIEVTTQNSGLSYQIEHATVKQREAGFDFTEFPNPNTFEQIIAEHELEPEGRIEVPSPLSHHWAWANDQVALITDHDPITGKQGKDTPEESREPGYAGSMAIQGESERVESLYNDLVESAVYVKDSKLDARDYI